MDQYVLGIDLGTTSVKACIVNTKNNHVEAQQDKDTQSGIPSTDVCSLGSIQDVPKIMSAMNFCVSKLPRQLLSKVSSIGICCQMHGVVMWNHTPEKPAWTVTEKDRTFRYEPVLEQISQLYTWQDNRCDQRFLIELPEPKSHLNVYSGYGTATLYWLKAHKPDKVNQYNCAGTLGDFAVAMLCDLLFPVMSDQNAAGWGFYDCYQNEWNTELLQHNGFPINLLPEVRVSGTLAGKLTENWYGIDKGTPIGIALGDNQCSVLSMIESPRDAIINISTSAQLSFIAHNFEPSSGPPLSGPIMYIPFFEGKFIAVAASLNGGNALATFVKMLQQWILELGHSVPQSKVWEKVISLGLEDDAKSDLVITPTCLGERHYKGLSGSVTNISMGNLHLGQVFRALCKGMIDNLHSMMPRDVLLNNDISRLLGNGGSLIRNKILQNEIEQTYGLPLLIHGCGDAAKGAAMAVSSLLLTSMQSLTYSRQHSSLIATITHN